MSMSDCPRCWDTPCTCGYDYKDYGVEKMARFMNDIIGYYTRSQIDEIVRFLIKKNPPENLELFKLELGIKNVLA